MFDVDRTTDVEALRTAAKILDAENDRLNKKLKLAFEMLEKAQGLTPEQRQQTLALLQEAQEESRPGWSDGGSERRPRPKPLSVDGPPQTGHGPTPQPKLPTQEELHTIAEADRTCPCCGGQLEDWAGECDERERIAVEKTAYRVIRHVLQKARCRCGHIETAEPPAQLVPGGRYDSSFAIETFVHKYADLLPRNRQVRMMRRAGLSVTSQTLWDQEWALVQALLPVKKRLHERLLREPVLICDETRWPLLGAKGRSSKNHYIWSATGNAGVIFEIYASRANESGKKLLDGFKGTVLADGYIVYTSLAASEGFTLACDWTHVRRKFLLAEDTAGEVATGFISNIGQLFLIEREIKAKVMDLDAPDAAEVRTSVRAERSKPVVAAIGEAAMRVKARPQDPIAKAVKYLSNRWDELNVFLDNPAVSITSNEIERQLRASVIARKTSLGSRSNRGLTAASVGFSIVGTCRKHGVASDRYLRIAVAAHLAGGAVPLPDEI